MMLAGMVSSAITFQSVTMSARAKDGADERQKGHHDRGRTYDAGWEQEQTDMTISCGKHSACRGAGQSGRKVRRVGR